MGDPHGGVLLGAKKHLRLQNIKKSPAVELISGSIMTGATRVILAAYYRPPNRTDSDYLTCSADEISSLRTSAKKSVVILGGDFNIPDIDWKQMTISN